ncbi:hypothetical protein GQ42DRAFT_165948 [Ramicandelaber brevisporus]|nr:hypothetical protein GQ42DRAFT_165948 [Ramicandelaber brevisporus]
MKFLTVSAAAAALFFAAVPAVRSAVTVYSQPNFGGNTDYCGGPEYDFVYPFQHRIDNDQHSIKSDNYIYEVYTKDMKYIACVDTQGWGNIASWQTVYYCVKTRRSSC